MLDGPALTDYLHAELDRYLAKPVDAVVLGCTHYPFVRAPIARVTGTDAVYDGGAGTARETERRLRQAGLETDAAGPGAVEFSSSDPSDAHRALCERLLRGELLRLSKE